MRPTPEVAPEAALGVVVTAPWHRRSRATSLKSKAAAIRMTAGPLIIKGTSLLIKGTPLRNYPVACCVSSFL